MSTFKEITSNEIKSSRSYLTQLVDVLQEDISSSLTRKTYDVWITGGVGPGVTSSLYHTVYDQDYTLQVANAVFDITVGLYEDGDTVQDCTTGTDSAGKLLFPSQSLMMREKVGIYQQFAQVLLGDSTSQFVAPYASTTASDGIDEALFICFKRLFHRDKLKRETFAMKFFYATNPASTNYGSDSHHGQNLEQTLTGTLLTNDWIARVYTDIGASTNKYDTYGGEISNIVNANATSSSVGLLFLDHGIAVIDLAKVMSGSQHVSGTIGSMNSTGLSVIGDNWAGPEQYTGNRHAKFIPDLLVSASIDDILKHITTVRFGAASATACTFQNITNINSTLVFCRAEADEFNYSSNPTYTDSANRIVVIDEGQEDIQRAFSFVTTIGLYDANDVMLAVAKLNRPVEKNVERDLSIRVRIDF